MQGTVAAVSCNDVYSFTKPVRDEITLVAGLGVAGDVHAGVTVRHRSRVAADPDQPNLRQVHLIRSELHDELSEAGYEVPPGGLGENVTTTGIDLLALPVGTVLRFGPPPATDAPASPEQAAAAGPAGATTAASPAGGATSAAGLAGGLTTSPSSAGGSSIAPSATGDPITTAAPASGAITAPGPAGGATAVVAAAQRVDLDDSAAAAVAALSALLATGAFPGHDEPRDQPSGADPRPAVVITGLRNPCQQINRYRSGLLKRVLGREADGSVSRRAGVMAVVLRGGSVRAGAVIDVELPALPHRALDRV